MATRKQEQAIAESVENGGNISKAMRTVGYSPATAKNPSKLTKSKGYAAVLKKYGLTESLVVKALVADIKAKPKRRIKELELGADILKLRGNDAEKQNPPQNILIINVAQESQNRYAPPIAIPGRE